MFLFFGMSLCFQGAFTRISAGDFREMLWNMSSEEATNQDASTYFSAEIPKECFVVREKGEMITTHNYTYYYVYGTKAEIALLTKQIELITDNETTIEEMRDQGCNITFVIPKAEASEYQISVFWITLIVCIIGVAGLLTGFLLWHCDDYSKDPANSLLFVTDGNRIVTGQ